MNNEEIKIKQSKATLIVGIILLCIFTMIEIAMLSECIEGENSFWAFFFSSLMAGLFFALTGVICIYSYIKNGKRMRNILARYGEANIINHIHQNTIGVFQKNQYMDKVYFTDTFVIEPSTAIIHYSEISWMYKHITRHKNTSSVSVAFALLDGTIFHICDYADDNDIANIMATCQRYNPNIIFGYSKETEAQHNFNVQRYKSGLGQIAHAPIAADTMQRSNSYAAGKRLFISGLTTLIGGFLSAILCMFAFDDLFDNTGVWLVFVIMIPVVIIGVSFSVSGWEKMQNTKDIR